MFSEICCKGDKKGVMNEVKALNKKIEEFCKSKYLALIRHSDARSVQKRRNYNFATREYLSRVSTLLHERQKTSDLGVGSEKINPDHNLTNQRQNISQNVS